MNQPVPDHRLIDACVDHIATLTSLPAHDTTDRESLQRECGWVECLLHLAKHNGLSLAGRVEAQKLVAASRDWVVEYSGEEPEGRGRA